MKRVIQITSFLLLVWMYACTRPVNHTEADVAFRNAYVVSHGADTMGLRADEVLYLTAMRLVYQSARFLQLPWTAFGLMSAVSVLCAAATVHLFFHFCYRRFSLRPLSSLLASVLFAVSYGFWRYAAEAAVIVPATLAAMATFYLGTHARLTGLRFALTTAMAAVTMLLSVLHVGAMLVVIPLYLCMHRRPWTAFAYIVAALGWLSAGLAALHAIHGDFMTSYLGLFRHGGHLPAAMLLKAIVGLGQSWISGNFLLGWAPFRNWLAYMFPYRMLAEEFFLGQQMPQQLVRASAATFVLAILCAAIAVGRSIQVRRKGNAGDVAGASLFLGRGAIWVVAMWAAVSMAGILWFQPENAEVWAFGLAPVWLSFCGIVIIPLAQTRTLWPVLAMALTMWLHNYVGGMRPLRLPNADLYVAQSTWVLSRARAEDAILIREATDFSFWMRLRFPGRVEMVADWEDPRTAFDDLATRHPRIWSLGTVFDPAGRPGFPTPPAGSRSHGEEAGFRGLAREFALVHEDDAVRVYVWPAPSADSAQAN